jgi:hypothetical protein
MSKKSVLEPPDPKPKKDDYSIVVPWGTVTIVVSGENLILDVMQPPSTPKRIDT